jgi:hypothetical protein
MSSRILNPNQIKGMIEFIETLKTKEETETQIHYGIANKVCRLYFRLDRFRSDCILIEYHTATQTGTLKYSS